jgi:hypothetical protein
MTRKSSLIAAIALAFSCLRAFAGPTITNVLVTATTGSTATIQWTTNTPASTQLTYGTDPSLPYTNNAVLTPVTSHSMTLTLLTAGPLYYVAPISTDNSGPTQGPAITFSLCGAAITPVQGTVNNYYEYGSYTLTWLPPAGTSQPPTVCGQPVTTSVTGLLDGGASFSDQIADASKIVPGPGLWQVSVTDAGNLAPITITSYLSQQSQNVSNQLKAAASTAGLAACITNTNTAATFPSTCGAGGGGGGSPGGAVGSFQYKVNNSTFGGVNITGIPKGNGSGPPTQAVGSTTGIGDYQLPITFNCSNGVSCSLAANTWNVQASGAAGSGNVNTAAAYQIGAYPAAGATIGGAPGLYALDPAMSLGQMNALFASLAGTNSTVLIPDGTPQVAITNTGVQTKDLRTFADYLQLSRFGVVCDANHYFVNLTANSNQVNVGAFFGAEAIGKTMTFTKQTGYLYNSPQYSWEATILGYAFPFATLSANAPFSFSGFAEVGTLNTVNLQNALNAAGYVFPLSIPSGCSMLTGPVHLNASQSIVGRQMGASGFVSLPGRDVLVQPTVSYITGWTTNGSVATFTGPNDFNAGDTVTLQGFPVTTAFNGVITGVLASGLSTTQFQVPMNMAAGSSTESGLAVPGNNSGGGVRLENFTTGLDSGVDSTQMVGGPWTDYDQNANPTVMTPKLRTVAEHSQDANNPCGPGWALNCTNGVANVTALSTTICVPTGIGRVPVAGGKIVFPYVPSGVFTTTVSSNTGSCPAGYAGSTLAAAMPAGYTATQAEWFSASSVQQITTTLPVNMSYPYPVTLANSIAPSPLAVSNVASWGHVRILGNEFDYMGVNGYGSPSQIILRRGPQTLTSCNGSGSTCVVANTPIVPLNTCPAANSFGGSIVPYPVVPTINAATITSWSVTGNVATFQASNYLTAGQTGQLSGFNGADGFNGLIVTVISAGLSNTQFEAAITHANGSGTDAGYIDVGTTPLKAAYYAGQCVGNAGLAFPQPNAIFYAQTGLGRATIKNLNANVTGLQDTNGTAVVYFGGNTAPYGAYIDGLFSNGTEFGLVEGPAVYGQHGVHNVGPTGEGLEIHNCGLTTAFPLMLVDAQAGKIDRCDTYTTGISPYDGTPIGPMTALLLGYTLDDQTGAVTTNVSNFEVDTHVSEPEHGSNIVTPVYVESDGTLVTFTNNNFEGAFNIFAGSQQKVINSQMSSPFINYGSYNSFENLTGLNSGYLSNAWGSNVMNWGTFSSCSAYSNQGGPLTSCFAGAVQSYDGHTPEATQHGNLVHPPVNFGGGQIVPGEWNTAGNLDLSPMSVGYVVDPTEPYWGSYAGCNLGGAAQCSIGHFDGFNGSILVGPNQRIVDGPYMLNAEFKSATAGGQFTIYVAAFNSGSGFCSAGGIIATKTITTTTTWTPVSIPIDFTGKAGCALQVQFYNATTTDQYRVGFFNFDPIPQWQLVPVRSFTTGSACSPNGAILGMDTSNLYICPNATIVGVPYTGGGGGSSSFSALTGGINTAATMQVGSGASLAATGSGTITATAAPFAGISAGTNTNALLIGSGGSLAASGSGTIAATTAGALAVAPSVCSSGNAPTGVDIQGNALNCQAIGGGGGGGATIQTNGVNNTNQTVLNFVNTASVLFTNPSGGVQSATVPTATTGTLGLSSPDNVTLGVTSGVYNLKSPGASTLVGFNGSNTYSGFTLGAGLAFSGSQLVLTNTYLTGTLSATFIPVASGASTLVNSLLSDTGTSLNYAGSAGISVTSSLPGSMRLAAGSGSMAALAANTSGFAAPVIGGPSYLFKLPSTAVTGYLVAAAPATGDGVLESALSFQHAEFTVGARGTWGTYTAPTVIAQAIATNPGHFLKLIVTNINGAACTTAPTFQVFDTAANTGVSVVGSTTQQAFGTASSVSETMAISAGDLYGVYMSNAGSSCTADYTVQAVVQEP